MEILSNRLEPYCRPTSTSLRIRSSSGARKTVTVFDAKCLPGEQDFFEALAFPWRLVLRVRQMGRSAHIWAVEVRGMFEERFSISGSPGVRGEAVAASVSAGA